MYILTYYVKLHLLMVFEKNNIIIKLVLRLCRKGFNKVHDFGL